MSGPEIEVVDTEIRTDPPSVAGARLALEVGRGAPEGTRFRWIQTEGPPVEIGDSSRASIEVTIPSGADRLGFLLVAATSTSVRVARVTVPIQTEAAKNSWGAPTSNAVKADAGDDQVGLVGHRVTLNGSRSRPSEAKNARWLQVSGAPVLAPRQDGFYLSFVPASQGTYKFLLVVAGNGEVSEPDEVSVLVGSPPAKVVAPIAQGTPAPSPLPAPVQSSPHSPTQILSSAFPKLPEAARLSMSMADIMEAISERASLYESYASLQSELSRRLEVVVPPDPAVRSAWNELVFRPLTHLTADKLLTVGLDLSQPTALEQPLSRAQIDLVREHFQGLARAFRVHTATR